jgi:hypothetical protein
MTFDCVITGLLVFSEGGNNYILALTNNFPQNMVIFKNSNKHVSPILGTELNFTVSISPPESSHSPAAAHGW